MKKKAKTKKKKHQRRFCLELAGDSKAGSELDVFVFITLPRLTTFKVIPYLDCLSFFLSFLVQIEGPNWFHQSQVLDYVLYFIGLQMDERQSQPSQNLITESYLKRQSPKQWSSTPFFSLLPFDSNYTHVPPPTLPHSLSILQKILLYFYIY